jgi:sugar phosphate permease
MNESIRRASESVIHSQNAAAEIEAAYVKSAKRIIPFCALLFVMAWLDRYNLGFAKLQMVKDLGFSEAVYGFGAGIVYLGYMLFEIPSNLYLQKIGARKTFARITILWGITSIAMMFVKTAIGFYILRFLLGSFEAGLYPGVLLYLTYWFPDRCRGLMQALFMISIPITSIVGGPISGWIMESMGGQAGLANWQWLFLLEGLPSIAVGLVALAIVVDKPEQAPWLTSREKELVIADLEADRRNSGPREHGFVQALKSSRLWLLALIYFCLISSNTTIGFFVPTIIQGLGVSSNINIGLLSAVPYIGALIAIVLVGRESDRTLERRYHSALPCLICAAGLIGIGLFANIPGLAFTALVIAVAAALCGNVVFWAIPPMLMGGAAAAGGIALINSIGNLSGWVGPSLVGALADITRTPATGLYLVAGLEVLASALILLFVPRRSAIASGTAPTGEATPQLI